MSDSATGQSPLTRSTPAATCLSGLVVCASGLSVFLLLAAACIHGVRSYSPDGWAYYELSRTIFGDFYRIHCWRSFVFKPPYSVSFPPLWPTILAVLNLVFRAGPAMDFAAALGCFAVFCIAAEWLGRTVFSCRWAGAASALVLLTDRFFVNEIPGGGNVPLQLALIAVIAMLLLRQRPAGAGIHVLLGVLTGLTVLNRFDAMPLVAGVAAFALWRYRRPLCVLALLAGALGTLAPWIAYSVHHFGVAFASDNSAVALSADPLAYFSDWPPDTARTAFNAPFDWALKVAGNIVPVLHATLGGFNDIERVLGAAGLGCIVYGAISGRRGRPWPQPDDWRTMLLPLIGFSFVLALPLLGYLTTGYISLRYFLPLRWWTLFVILGLSVVVLRERRWRSALVPIYALAAVLATTMHSGSAAMHNLIHGQLSPAAELSDPPLNRAVLACMAGAVEPVVVTNPADAARFGALTGHTSLNVPGNWSRLTADRRAAFLREYRAGYVLFADAAQASALAGEFDATQVAHCPVPLFRIRH